MKRIPMPSSVIRSAGYNPRTTVLEIEFQTQLVYDYRKVPRTIFDALLKAGSKGRYFNAHIRDHYPYVVRTVRPKRLLV